MIVGGQLTGACNGAAAGNCEGNRDDTQRYSTRDQFVKDFERGLVHLWGWTCDEVKDAMRAYQRGVR